MDSAARVPSGLVRPAKDDVARGAMLRDIAESGTIGAGAAAQTRAAGGDAGMGNSANLGALSTAADRRDASRQQCPARQGNPCARTSRRSRPRAGDSCRAFAASIPIVSFFQ